MDYRRVCHYSQPVLSNPVAIPINWHSRDAHGHGDDHTAVLPLSSRLSTTPVKVSHDFSSSRTKHRIVCKSNALLLDISTTKSSSSSSPPCSSRFDYIQIGWSANLIGESTTPHKVSELALLYTTRLKGFIHSFIHTVCVCYFESNTIRRTIDDDSTHDHGELGHAHSLHHQLFAACEGGG